MLTELEAWAQCYWWRAKEMHETNSFAIRQIRSTELHSLAKQAPRLKHVIVHDLQIEIAKLGVMAI